MVLNKSSKFKVQSSKLFIFISLLGILAIASFFRLWQLDKIPPGLYPDVAINGNDALDSLKTGNFKVFYPENNGREGLFFWLIAFSFSIFGASIWSIKIVAATIGILTVLGLYLLTKELFSRETSNKKQAISVALLSSFFLAISFWHTNFSRIGFRAILLPFILVFGFYFLFRAFKNKKLSDFVFSGIFWGLGFYTYTSFRLAVFVLLIFLILKLIEYLKETKIEKTWKWLWNKMYLQGGWWKVDLFLVIVILVALPLALYFLQNPQDFVGRMAPISIFAADEPIKEFSKSLILHLGMFNFWGDQNWRHNFSGEPMLFWPIGILFLIGIFSSIKALIKFRTNKNLSLVISHLTLVIWFFIMLLPGILTYEGVPHALRVIGVIPPVYIFSGIGGYQLYNFLNKRIKNQKFLIVLCFLFLAFLLYSEFNKYFNVWAKNPIVKNEFTERFADIGYFLNSLPEDVKKYVIVNASGVPVPWPDGIPMPAQTPMFIERTKYSNLRTVYLLPEKLDQIIINEKPTIIVPMRYEQGLFTEFSQRFPQGESQKENEIWFYKVNF
ncbi:MAG: hypothetical protein C0412_16635 [Flavobacterium sp.]|nr:hypothetical protein [Flavobacterium sp.]